MNSSLACHHLPIAYPISTFLAASSCAQENLLAINSFPKWNACVNNGVYVRHSRTICTALNKEFKLADILYLNKWIFIHMNMLP